VKILTNYQQFLDVNSQRIEGLEREIEILKRKNTELVKNQKSQTGDPENTLFQLIKSQIIGRDPLNINGYLTINKGSNHGIKIDQAVICKDGLVGRIKYAGANESLVETIENNTFSVSAIDQRTDVHGMVIRFRQLQFEYIRKDDRISVNDTIITSGMSDIFPPGIVIGFVSNIEIKNDLFFKSIYLEPAARVNSLYYVYVINNNPADGKMTNP
jgi:rod shape-determining protein MreC